MRNDVTFDVKHVKHNIFFSSLLFKHFQNQNKRGVRWNHTPPGEGYLHETFSRRRRREPQQVVSVKIADAFTANFY